jgi:hypothetical protein
LEVTVAISGGSVNGGGGGKSGGGGGSGSGCGWIGSGGGGGGVCGSGGGGCLIGMISKDEGGADSKGIPLFGGGIDKSGSTVAVVAVAGHTVP